MDILQEFGNVEETEQDKKEKLDDIIDNAFSLNDDGRLTFSEDFAEAVVEAVQNKMRKHGHLDKVPS